MRKEDKWKEECMQEIQTTKGPGAETINETTDQTRIADRKNQNSSYFFKAAENQLETDTPQAAVILGYFAAENKVEEALAHAGYEVHTHLCTIKGLSRVLERKDLAQDLEQAYSMRKEVNYETDLGQNDENAIRFIEERIKPLIEELEEIIETLQS